MPKIVGIDLGTSTSCVAFMDRGHARILVQDDRDRILPSVVSLHGRSRPTVGASAAADRELNPDYTFTGLKRLLGRRFDDPVVTEHMGYVSYEIVPGPQGEAWVRGPDRAYAPEELLALVLRRLREVAQASLSEEITHCVIGVPAHFDMIQKDAVRAAAMMAGMTAERLLSEPTAAAVAYGVDRAVNRTIAVYDFGGGTFDITILKIAGRRFRVLATAGDPYLGGEDFDARIVDWIAERFMGEHKIDLRLDKSCLNRVRLAAEKVKVELSSSETAPIRIPYIADDTVQRSVILDVDYRLERDEYEELVADLIDRTREPCRRAIAAAKIDVRDIDEVVLVGGMTRMPKVQEVVREIFGRIPTGKVDPFVAVALGCATQGAAIAGAIKSIALHETMPMSLGVEVGNGSMVPIIRAGKPIPAKETVRFGMADQAAPAAAIRVCQGDLRVAADNRQLGVVILNDMQEGPGAEPIADVTFDVDEDGVLSVYATNARSGSRVEYRVHPDTGLSPGDLEGLREIDELEEEVNGEA